MVGLKILNKKADDFIAQFCMTLASYKEQAKIPSQVDIFCIAMKLLKDMQLKMKLKDKIKRNFVCSIK